MKNTIVFFIVLSIFFISPSTHGDVTLPVNETTSSSEAAFTITNTGLGNSGIFRIDNPDNDKSALGVLTNGQSAIVSINIGGGAAGMFANIENSNTAGALLGMTLGLGIGGAILSANEDSVEPTLIVGNAGRNTAAQIFTLNDTSFQPALEVTYPGRGNAITVTNQRNGAALQATIEKHGSAIHAAVEGTDGDYGIIINVAASDSSAQGVAVYNGGLGTAGWFRNSNANNDNAALVAFTRGNGRSITAAGLGGGDSIWGVIPEDAASISGSNRAAVRGEIMAQGGSAAIFKSTHGSNWHPAVSVHHEGAGPAIVAEASHSWAINTIGGILASGDLRVHGMGDFRREASEGMGLRVFSFDEGVVARFSGDILVDGYAYKSGGGFKIDHPLDPANKYLYHSYVESPEMMNVYNGVAQLDSKGEAWVKLPAYFDALNKDFRYQLTPIGAPGPNLHIAKEISKNRFYIAGGTNGMKVSWQVTGVRKDRYAQKHRILAEIKKEVKDRGKYLHPRVFGKSDTMRIGWDEKADDREQLKKKQFVAEKKEASKLRWETLKKSIKKDEMIAQKIVADQKSRKPTELKNLKGKMNKARKDLNKMVKNLRK